MVLNRNTVITAFEGALIRQHRELIASGYRFTQDHENAILAINADYEAFCNLVRAELNRWPLTRQYFCDLVEERLLRTPILESGFISSLFSQENEVEARLSRIHLQVANFPAITQSVGFPSNRDSGNESDEIVRNVWTELFALDFLIHHQQRGFTNFEKVVRRADLPAVDFTASHGSETYAIEVTRLRKRNFQGSTLPNMTSSINLPYNQRILRNAIKQILFDKNDQMRRFSQNPTQPINKRLLVVKTSQSEYQDANIEVKQEFEAQFRSGRYPFIDELLLIYDVENFDWLM